MKNKKINPTHVVVTTTNNSPFSHLREELQKAVKEEGYVEPSPIQKQSIPPLLEGRDLLGIAQTGTGKTAAFALPLLQRLADHRISSPKSTPRALILAPTRELAAQIGESIVTYGRHLRLRSTVIFGGVKQGRQVDALRKGVDILIATPGRLLDLQGQGLLHLDKIEYFVLDEVDRMLDMGFIHDIQKVLKMIPKKRQTLFFSATMPPKMEKLAYTMVNNPVKVTIAPEQPTVEKIEQRLLFVDKNNKIPLLADIIKNHSVDKVIVFTQMKHVANMVVKKLEQQGIESAAIHGNKSQAARVKALDRFKKGNMNVLVATDVAARGIDVDRISHVVNYDLPVEAETYVHRIGRTARAGAEGKALSFCSPEEMAYLKEIEKLLGKSIPRDLDHPFHSEEARFSTLPAPPQGRGARQIRGSGKGFQGQRKGPSSQKRFSSNRRNNTHSR
jgi:ATP-dependent RNA helicase RhlE